MGFVGSLLGNNTGAGFQASSTGITTPTTAANATAALSNANSAITQQQQFLQALQAQNGIGNQNQVYSQLQGVANGTGPNPAQAMLAQSTGQNVANQAALMAGQRGSSANVGLLARQAAQQGAATQQQAAGQAASLQANQSLNAINSAGNLATNQVGNQAAATSGLAASTQGEQQNILNAIQGQNASNVAMQSNQNSANAGIAGINAQGQQGILGGVLGGAGSALGLAKGGAVQKFDDGGPVTNGPITSSSVLPQSGAKSNTAKLLRSNTPSNQSNFQQAMQQMGENGSNNSGASSMNQAGQMMGKAAAKGIQSLFSSGAGSGDVAASTGIDMGGGAAASGALLPAAAMALAKGGKVPALLSPGEQYLPPKEVAKVAKGEKDGTKAGKRVPGKAEVKGDSLKNDKVKATLEEGGVVIPRSVMQSKNPGHEAKKFVQAVLAKQGLGK